MRSLSHNRAMQLRALYLRMLKNYFLFSVGSERRHS
jgi:hypothetical protein